MSNVDEARRNGGPAFPVGTAYQGLTMRDYFAAKALQAIINETGVNLGPNIEQNDVFDAKLAYRMADAMLKAREQ